MDFNSNAERIPLQIQGLEFAVPIVFEEGHVLTGPQAAVLNQTLRENLRNNFASTVKAAVEKATNAGEQPDADALQEELDNYLADYEFGINRGGGRTLDPVEREAREQAIRAIKKALKGKGIAIKEVSKERMEQLIEKALTEHPQIYEKAKQVVAAKAAAVSDVQLDV